MPLGIEGAAASGAPWGTSGSRPSRATSPCRPGLLAPAAPCAMPAGGGGSSRGSAGLTAVYHWYRRLAFHGCSKTSHRRMSDVNVSRPACVWVLKAVSSSTVRSTSGGPRSATSRVSRAARPAPAGPAPSASSHPRRSAGLLRTWSATRRAACSAAGRTRASCGIVASCRRLAGRASAVGCGATRNSCRRCRRKRAARGSCAKASSYSECCRWACRCASSRRSNAGLKDPNARELRPLELPCAPGAHDDTPEPADPVAPPPPRPPVEPKLAAPTPGPASGLPGPKPPAAVPLESAPEAGRPAVWEAGCSATK
mmetsp:Transcript_6110/g.18135  ORF Transcript_6110/g.18135 Transcript_6110/m.18135 type:complete len:312 (+) Transcript_6110:1178-2113(+)